MNARSLARVLVIVALACTGLFTLAGIAAAQLADTSQSGRDRTVVQNGNDSEGSEAVSADVDAGNETIVQSGPAARDGGRAAMVGDASASVDQDNKAASGPANAGSQVSRPRNGATEQNSNRSSGAVAESGPVDSFNAVEAHNGPFASGEGANATMVGDGNLDISQDADGRSGPAWSGSQNTETGGIVQNTNQCGDAITDCGDAFTGEVEILNVFGDEGATDVEAPSGTGPVAISDADSAVASLVGDADAVITQSGEAVSGPALNGTQTTDTRGGTVQDDNSASGGDAESGPASTDNFGVAFIGPVSFAGGLSANAQMVGDADGDLDQDAQATSGSAETGSQVVGGTRQERGAVVQNRSASEDDTAVTGAAEASSEVEAFSGPVALGFDEDAQATLAGDSAFDVRTRQEVQSGAASAGKQEVDARGGVVQDDNTSIGNEALTGDAISEDLVLAVAGPIATADFEPARAVQSGDASNDVDLRSEAISGGAGVGDQVARSEGGSFVQDTNLVEDSIAASGDAITTNDVTGVAGAIAGEPFVGTLDAPADAVLSGDATFDVRLDADAMSGVAVTGVQRTDARNDAVSQNVNDALGDESESGAALAGNAITGFAGPFAGLEDFLLAEDVILGALQVGDASSRSSMVGDATIEVRADAEASSGDVRTATQDTEARGGFVQNDNLSEDSLATSGDACASPDCSGEIVDIDGEFADVPGGNTAVLFAGPASGGEGSSDATLVGDADADLRMEADASTGDGTASSQRTETRGGSVVENGNDSIGAIAGCEDPFDCQATAGNLVDAFAGPLAFADADLSATANQVGDAEVRTRGRGLEAEADGGDTVAGSQFTDARGGTVQNDNLAEDAEAVAGPVTSFNAVGADPFDPSNEDFATVAGPFADAFVDDARATLAGDADLRLDLQVEAASGDAISGSQLTGFRDRQAAQVSNESIGDLAESGEALGFNAGGGVVGPRAEDADVAQAGDAEARIDLDVEIEAEGDAIAGTQVIGRRGTDLFESRDTFGAEAQGASDGLEGSDGGVLFESGWLVGRGRNVVLGEDIAGPLVGVA